MGLVDRMSVPLPQIAVPHSSCVYFQRVAHGSGIGYAFIVDREWVGTLFGADGSAMWSEYMKASERHRPAFLHGVVLGLLAAEKSVERLAELSRTDEHSVAFWEGLVYGLQAREKTMFYELKHECPVGIGKFQSETK